MTQELEGVFEELGLTQYLDTFIDQGFESWDIVLDITEDDLERLGVKLGHRRKLQRKIANWRGHQNGGTLTSPTKAEDSAGKSDGSRADAHEGHHEGSTKRKYRRHPKPDDNAPERPPSAYVLFSNMVRDEMKGQNLSFIEIAKLVGERWQALMPVEKEPFETRALQAKEKYSRELAEYRKTPEYRHYAQYLSDFKAKQAQSQDPPKRPKIDPSLASTSNSHSAHGGSTSAARIAARDNGDHHLPGWRHRLGSNASQAEAQFAMMPTKPMGHKASMDDPVRSPRATSHFEAPESAIPLVSGPRSRDARARSASLIELPNPTVVDPCASRQLPPLSDMILDDRAPGSGGISRSPDMNGFAGVGRTPIPDGISISSFRDDPRIASLRHQSSSSGSSGSSPSSTTSSGTNQSAAGSSNTSTGSLNSSGGVPIHALLTGDPLPTSYSAKTTPPPFAHRPMPGNTPPMSDNGVFAASGERLAGGVNPSLWQVTPNGYSVSKSVSPISEPVRNSTSTSPLHPAMTIPPLSERGTTGSQIRGAGLGIEREPERAAGLDGMSALLRAGEIVERTTP